MRKDLLEEAAFMLEKLANRLEERMQESFEMLDRIEALEAALRKIADRPEEIESKYEPDVGGWVYWSAQRIARAALAGGQDK